MTREREKDHISDLNDCLYYPRLYGENSELGSMSLEAHLQRTCLNDSPRTTPLQHRWRPKIQIVFQIAVSTLCRSIQEGI